ncbi:lipopolysaccharide biosynthesis protein [Rhodococcoides yunnanense]|uniref:lipopolysaccharide biosynthesis protein n=1 Tax=Rhodococcoides yunnanense TaxID=278209 RepID=UPI0022B13F59|nr:lipopolysaccharide biosynthesis protein [Rhodococcus yunnanensis]MCZ4278361.1 lipopolysaccharide biosynthesis protein [Rhodococcus yunnanensis]
MSAEPPLGTAHVGERGLSQRAAQGAALTFGGQVIRFMIQLTGIIVLSRILGPEIIGLFAIAMVVVGLGEVVRDFGLSSAAIQTTELTKVQRTNLFWINTALGVALFAGSVALAGLVADFYNSDQLQAVLIIAATVLVINGVSTQYRAGLSRDLKFKEIAILDVVAMMLATTVAIICALAGAGIWALVIQQLLIAVVALVLCVAFARWLPGMPRRSSNMRSLLIFGWNVGLSQLVNYSSRNVDTIVIGRQFGLEPLGFYNRAYQMLTLPLNQISVPATKVAFPILAKLQGDDTKFNGFLMRGQLLIVAAVSALFVPCAAMAEPLVVVLLGEEWKQSAVIFQVLAAAGLVQSAAFATYWVFLAKGLTKASLQYTVLTKSILVALVILGANWGVIGVAAGYTVATAIAWPIGLLWLKRISTAPIGAMAKQAMHTIMVFVAAGMCSYVVAKTLSPDAPIVSIVSGCGVYLLALGLLFAALRSVRSQFTLIADAVRRASFKSKTIEIGE